MSRVKQLIETIRSLIEGEFSGYIKINFSQGSLGRVEQSEELDETIAHSGSRKGNNKSEDKAFLYDNVIDIRNCTDNKGRSVKAQRSEYDRRFGDNHYTGPERRCCVDRRSSQDRRSSRDRKNEIHDINRKKQSETKNLKDKQKNEDINRRDAEK
ncbi:MAG: hypothetical protein ACLPN1_13415 [Dissulfurispiraceae bacterium]|jgi:hypothetical protein